MSTSQSKGHNGRDKAGRFKPGHSLPGPGNPHLKHAGALQKAVREAVTADELKTVMQKLRDLAGTGDVAAARLLIERCIGKPIDEPRPFAIELPELTDAKGVADAMRCVAAAAAAGDMTPSDAAAVTGVLRQVADATTFAELDQRIAELEARP